MESVTGGSHVGTSPIKGVCALRSSSGSSHLPSLPAPSPDPPLPSLHPSLLPCQSLPVPPFLPPPPLSYPSSLFSASLSGSRSSRKPGADLRPEHDLRTRRSCAGSAGGSEVPGCSVPLPSRPRLLLEAAALCKCPARAARWGSWPEGLAGGLARSAPARVPCLSGSLANQCPPPDCLVLCLSGPLVCPGPLPSRGQPATLLPVVWHPAYTCPGLSAPAPPGGPGCLALSPSSFPVLGPGIGPHCTPGATPLAHNSARNGVHYLERPSASNPAQFAANLE